MGKMLWRMVYALIWFMLAVAIIPRFATLVGFPLGEAWPLIQLCFGGIAVLYVLFGPEPRTPF